MGSLSMRPILIFVKLKIVLLFFQGVHYVVRSRGPDVVYIWPTCTVPVCKGGILEAVVLRLIYLFIYLFIYKFAKGRESDSKVWCSLLGLFTQPKPKYKNNLYSTHKLVNSNNKNVTNNLLFLDFLTPNRRLIWYTVKKSYY